MAGTISSLGVGSGLDLQGIVDQLRETDQQVLDLKRQKVTALEEQLEEYTAVKNSLYSIKSAALDLSLESTYLSRTATSSNEDVLTATVLNDTEPQSASVTVSQLATNSSFMSAAGKESADTSVYVPTSQQSEEAIADPANYITADDTLTITYGSGDTMQTINVDVTAGMTLTEVVDAINTDAENGGASTYVTAEDYVVGSDHYLRISATSGGSGEDNRVMITDQLSDDTLAAPDKVMSLMVGDAGFNVTVAADTTLTELADLINGATDNAGVTASVIDNGDAANPYFLSLVANETGEDNRISFLVELADLAMEEKQGAAGASLNAQFSLDGIDYQRQTNTVDDVISGVTLTLGGAGSATVEVGTNDTEIQDMVKALVNAYNSTVQQLAEQTGYDEETEEFGPLAGTTVRGLRADLEGLMTSTVGADETGTVTSLFDLGMQFERDGTITLDEEMLADAFSENSDAAQAFFLGDSDREVTGFGDMVNERMRVLVSSEGQIAGEENSATSRISSLELNIERETERLEKKYELMTKQFIELDRYMNQMTSISSYLTSQFDSLSSAWGAIGGANND